MGKTHRTFSCLNSFKTIVSGILLGLAIRGLSEFNENNIISSTGMHSGEVVE